MSAASLHAIGLAGDPASPVHRLDPRAKLVGLAGITVVGVSTPPRLWPVLVACALTTFAGVTSKATIGTVSAVLLGATTTFPDVLHGLERMRAPRLLTLIAAFMYRYLFVITGEARRMRVALAARGYRPRTALQAAAIGRVATALFLRTFERGERVYVAMLARGYNGSTPRLRELALGRADVVFVAALATVLLPLRVIA
jgi:cobalt/nickel transport system permease protein